jgi:hypothetical protein
LIAAVCVIASAEGVSTGRVEFVPASFVPGQLVTLYATLDPGDARWAEATPGAVSVDAGENGPSVLSVAMEKRSGAPLLVVRFVAWRAGPGFLPAMTVGGLESPRIRFECVSALADGDLRSPEPLPQLEPPGLYARLYLLGGALLVVIVAGLAAATKAAPWFRALAAKRAFAAARREFDESLAMIAGIGSQTAAWAELCSVVRRFVGLRSGKDWSALTASEVESLPEDAAPGGVLGDVASILATGDAVRFAGRRDSPIGAGVSLAGSIADRLDEACLEPVPPESASERKAS